MNGNSNLASSPSPPMAGNGARARRSLELTNTKETNAWEGLAIGAVTLARTFSTGSHRLCRSGVRSRRGAAGRHGRLPGALRRAFSMRRHPAPPGVGDGYYWRIHNMDGDGDDHGDDNAGEGPHDEEKKKKKGRREEGEVKEEATGRRRKKRGNILKACKKLLRL